MIGVTCCLPLQVALTYIYHKHLFKLVQGVLALTANPCHTVERCLDLYRHMYIHSRNISGMYSADMAACAGEGTSR